MIKPIWRNDKYDVDVFESRNLKILKQYPDNYFDGCVTDPPYGLNFMGAKWDYQIPKMRIWEEVLRVLKPGAHLLAFGGTRTFHRIWCSIEDAGFDLRDTIMWIYGSGFPKGSDISKQIDKHLGNERKTDYKPNFKDGVLGKGKGGGEWGAKSEPPVAPEAHEWNGWNTNLKPAFEPIVLARKPIEGTVAQNVLKYGTGGLNIDECRVGTDGESVRVPQSDPTKRKGTVATNFGITRASVEKFRAAQQASIERTNAPGRWPANVIHDGSEEMLDEFAKYGESVSTGKTTRGKRKMKFGMGQQKNVSCPIDSGTVARFFYTAKASKHDRGHENNHPTVKPVSLMSWLCKLIVPKGARILDPFMGSGTTGVAAILAGMKFVGIDKDEKYCQIASKRLKKTIQKYAGTFGF